MVTVHEQLLARSSPVNVVEVNPQVVSILLWMRGVGMSFNAGDLLVLGEMMWGTSDGYVSDLASEM